MQIIFKFGINIDCPHIHLRNRPAVFQQSINTNKIFIIINIILLSIITAVAYVNYFLLSFPYL